MECWPERRQVQRVQRKTPRKPTQFRGRQEKKESKLSLDKTRDRVRMMNSQEKVNSVQRHVSSENQGHKTSDKKSDIQPVVDLGS